MPDWIGDWLTKPKGWPFGLAVAASGFLLLWRSDVAPFSRAADEWVMAASLVAMFGWAVTVIAICAWTIPQIVFRFSTWKQALLLWRRRRAPMGQIDRLTSDEKKALGWLLINDLPIDSAMTNPAKGLVNAGFLIPMRQPTPHHAVPMRLSKACLAQREQLLDALRLSDREVASVEVV